MSTLNGRWDCITKTPMGDKPSIITFVVAGDTFSGHDEGEAGKLELHDGKIDGEVISWNLKVSKPFPLTLKFKASIDGDQLSGKVQAGLLGTAKISGRRIGD
ncbi:MAG: hypothetical protein AAGC84_08560 [Pseudomonas sp.]